RLDLPPFPTRRSSDLIAWCSWLILRVLSVRLLQPACLAQRIAQHVLDLGVEAAQLVVRPALGRRQDLGADAQLERLALGHGPGRSEEHTSELQSRENL